MTLPHPANHPTGIAGALAAVVVIVAHAFGLRVDVETASALIGVVVTLVSLASPRHFHQTVIHFEPESDPLPDNVVPINRDKTDKGA